MTETHIKTLILSDGLDFWLMKVAIGIGGMKLRKGDRVLLTEWKKDARYEMGTVTDAPRYKHGHNSSFRVRFKKRDFIGKSKTTHAWWTLFFLGD